MIRHFSHIFFAEAETFIFNCLAANRMAASVAGVEPHPERALGSGLVDAACDVADVVKPVVSFHTKTRPPTPGRMRDVRGSPGITANPLSQTGKRAYDDRHATHHPL